VDLGTIANVATAMTVLVGVVFGLVEMRRARRDREERAAFSAVQALMTPEWMSSSMIVHSIPNFRPFVELERMRAGTQKSWEWVSMACGATRPPQCEQDKFKGRCTDRLSGLAALICVSNTNRRT
jgi:hypothetical protein